MPNNVGTLLPLFAFPQDENFLPSVKKFIDWLALTNQKYWQLLPIYPLPKNESSPYSSYGIGLKPFSNSPLITPLDRKDFLKQQPWARDLSIFDALTNQFQTDNWWQWPQGYHNFNPRTLIKYINDNPVPILKSLDAQIQAHLLWQEIKQHTSINSIQMIGDLPFYIDRRSPLVWANQSLFQEPHNPDYKWTTGVPNSSTYPRQVWNHPLYNWDNLNGLKRLWQIRLRHAHSLFDLLRIDHSIGFFHYGVIHQSDSNQDYVANAPGQKMLSFIYKTSQFYNLKLIAEDITDFDSQQLHKYLNKYQIPTTRVFTQGIKNSELDSYFINTSEYTDHTIAYSSNHDTEPLLPWLTDLSPELYQQITQIYNLPSNIPCRQLSIQIRDQILKSNAQIRIIPIQDWLLSSDRINTPGVKKTWTIPQWSILQKHLNI